MDNHLPDQDIDPIVAQRRPCLPHTAGLGARAAKIRSEVKPSARHALCTLALTGAVLIPISACQIQLNRDPLVSNLPKAQAQACREAVGNELARRGVSQDWIRQVSYHKRTANTRGASSRITGFDAWVFPKEGRGALVIELSETCKVRGVWAHGTR